MNGASSPQADSSTSQMILGVQCGCRVVPWKDSGHSIEPCPLHGAADDLLAALEGLRDDLQTRLDMATDGATEADGLVRGEDANRSWRAWLFDVMNTHGKIARAAIKKAAPQS